MFKNNKLSVFQLYYKTLIINNMIYVYKDNSKQTEYIVNYKLITGIKYQIIT